MIRYFAYGTTQSGYFNHRELGLGAPLRRARLRDPHAIVVPRLPACSNPGCRYLHRMATLITSDNDLHPEGDLFALDEAMLAKLDTLELAGPYTRIEATLDDGSTAYTYRALDELAWSDRVREGLADAVERYTHDDEPQLKPCCVADPRHDGPHDVIDPLLA